jgi:SAM-dependent methyltransferase
MTSTDTKQAEKEYLSRSGSLSWEIAKPFSPPGSEMMAHGADLLHDFSVAMLLLRPSPDDLILDLGAGACWCSDLLGRLNRTSIAVDISHDMLQVGRSRPGTAIRAVTGDMESLPFRSSVFTKTLCLSAMHHVPDIGKALREVARVLTPDGVALFSEPGKGHGEADVSTVAMREYGVLEQDILIADFMAMCRAAGFGRVCVKPLAYAVPGYELDLEQWQAWSRLAASSRPRRALAKILLGCAEIFGLGKRGRLFEDTFAISLVRTLRPLIERHPIIVASKKA